MSKTKRAPGWGARFKRVRERLGLSQGQFARLSGYSQPSVGDWESDDVCPAGPSLKKGLVAAGIWDLDRTFSWLADGEGREPRWLSDLALDPTKEPVDVTPDGNPPRPGSRSGIAMPHAILEHARKALEATRVARAALANVAEPGPSAWARAALNDTAEEATKALDALRALPSSSAPNKNIPVVPMLLVA